MEIKTSKNIGYAFLSIALVIFLLVIYKNNTRRYVPIIFSPKSVLDATWLGYKNEYLEKDTLRTLDKQQANITTSEGQSYTMLRAVMMDDQQTFNTSWQWTKDNLKRKNSHLISWLFGKRTDGTYGVLTERNGQNSASDADVDIALSLVFAFERWKDNTYLGDAHDLITDIWNEEVVMIKGRPYLAANNVEKTLSSKIIINPSYFAPYAYKIFAEIDPSHDWKSLVDTSYEIADESIVATLDKDSSARIPPDWLTIDRVTGEILPVEKSTLTTNYGYDALRLPWRMAVDWQWNKDERAFAILQKMTFLDSEWKNNKGIIFATYAHDGVPVNKYESPAMYGGSIGYFMTISPSLGKEVYEKKLQTLYNPDTQSWKQKLSYYDDNWVWFGISLYNGLFPNLYKQ